MMKIHEKHDAFKELINHFDTLLQYRQQLLTQLERENNQVLHCLKQIKAKNDDLMMLRQTKNDLATKSSNELYEEKLENRSIPLPNDYYRPQVPPVVISNIPDHVTKERIEQVLEDKFGKVLAISMFEYNKSALAHFDDVDAYNSAVSRCVIYIDNSILYIRK